MIDPLQHYPAALKEIIETFEVQGLDAACEKARLLPPSQNSAFQHKPSEDGHDLGPWLWSIYFDAHWMSSSIAEWTLIHQRLVFFLEQEGTWLVYHESLLEKLQLIYLQAQELHQHLLSYKVPEVSNLPSWLLERLRMVLTWLPKDQRLSFRLPQHRLLFKAEKTAREGFWDSCRLLKHPVAIGKLYLASDLTCACYALSFIEEDHGLLPIDNLWDKEDLFEPLQQAFIQEPSHPLAPYWKKALELGADSSGQSLLFFVKQIQNESRKLCFDHYGPIARLSLLYRYQLSDWYEKLLLRDLPLKQDSLKEELAKVHTDALKKTQAFCSSEKKLPRVLHIISQVIDHGHAPSKILHRLLAMGDRERLDQAVIITESLTERLADYPSHLRYSGSSEKRGSHFLKFLEKERFAYLLERPNTPPQTFESLDSLADRLAARLNPIDADAIIFHGPEPLHHALASRLQKPLKVLFEHGTLPKAPGFDLALCCLEDTLTTRANELQEIGTKIRILPFAADSRWTWKPEMPKNGDFGLEDTCRIATTISNHLETRLQPKFCQAVSRVLQRVPDLYYLPIGVVNNPKQLLERFDPSIRSRIRFLGSQQDPSHFTRCMDLYFNEFPFGSCYGILDAMASGCPVVTMYDPKGPPQARYGGLFMGIEESIQNNSIEAYVEKACLWLTDPLEYFRASQKSFQQYEWRSNYWAYIHQFEDILLSEIQQRRHS
jgi:glycosyltransferase involved in cell wall biosynthesis